MQAKIVNLGSRVALLLMFLGIATSPTTPVHSGQPDNKVEDKPGGRTIEQQGVLVPFEQVDVYAKIAAFVGEVPVDIGDRVKKGQLLAKLWAPEMEKELDKKKALVRKAELGVVRAKQGARVLAASVERTMAEVEEAKAALDKCQTAVARWGAEHERAKSLVEKNVIDRQIWDEIAYKWKAAKADELQAKAKIRTGEAVHKEAVARREKGDIDIDIAHADLQAAQAEAAQYHALLTYMELRAPFDGVVAQRSTHTGHFQRPPAGANPEPMFVLVRVDRVRVVVDVPEKDALRVENGTEATVLINAIQGQVFKGTVARTGWRLDPETRTLRVEIDLPNPDGNLRPGMYAHVSLTPKTPQLKLKN
jgi:HlyD family secretion protein